MVPLFRATVNSGVLRLQDRQAFERHVRAFEGKPVEVSVRPFRVQRTLPQNKYYWFAVSTLAEHLGYEREELHCALRYRFLRVSDEGLLERALSTTELDTAQFVKYMESVRQLAAEMGCVIPDPGEVEL